MAVDFSAILIIQMAAVVAAAVTSAAHRFVALRERAFLVSLAATSMLSVLILRPWNGLPAGEWPILILSLGLVGLWAAGGTVVGMAVGLLLVRLGTLIASAFRR